MIEVTTKRAVLSALLLTPLLGCGQGEAQSAALEDTNATDASSPGYTLVAPLRSKTTVLLDMEGEVVHRWTSEVTPGNAVYLLDSGNLLRTGKVEDNEVFHGGGEGGRLLEIAPDGTVVWDYSYSSDRVLHHHDIEVLPNGNVLLIAWERRTAAEAIAAGRDPALVKDVGMWPDHIVEVEPVRPNGGRIVWEWHVWDHLIQDHDPSKANFGVVADHPELVDLNADRQRARRSEEEEREELDHLRGLGYVGGDDDDEPEVIGRTNPDWCHTNSIDYHPGLDQILLSVREFNEIWIIDHGTTTAEAAGHTGGRYGKGGDLLYRWGNPQVHGAGTPEDQQLFGQHDAQWIAAGRPGEGNVLVFNNGLPQADRAWSSVDELILPMNDDGHYTMEPGAAALPASPAWSYAADERGDFFSPRISGAQRQPNGTTLVCAGEGGRIFEVTAEGKTVWEYQSKPLGDEVERRGPGGPRKERGTRGERGERGAQRGRPEGPPPHRRPEFGREGGGGPEGQRPPRRGGGGPGRNGSSLFRAERYDAAHPGVQVILTSRAGQSDGDSASLSSSSHIRPAKKQ